jgi:hypothetical protein
MRFPSDLSAFLKLPAASPGERHFHHDHHSITPSSPPMPSRRSVGLSVFFLVLLHRPSLSLSYPAQVALGTQLRYTNEKRRLKKSRKISGKPKK